MKLKFPATSHNPPRQARELHLIISTFASERYHSLRRAAFNHKA
jgi:hypothetical protein